MTEAWQHPNESDLLDRHPAATIVVSPEGKILAWNRAATDLFGFETDEAVGQDFDALLVPPTDTDNRHELIGQAQQGGSACYTADRKHKSGSLIAVSAVMDIGAEEAPGALFLTFRPASQMICLCGEDIGENDRPPLKQLTTRQRQVLRLIAEGRSTREIAHRLTLSVKTIETHRGHLMQRLKLKSVAGLVRYAVAVGLVPASPWSTKAKVE
ncbi:MAG TPA: LuxR C-terminal-related transcriptional regulator [Gemmatimonadales bacterium]|jgi:PAS domain S-box-containing protein